MALGILPESPRFTQIRFRNAAVLGTGQMGAGIAQISLENGVGVKLKGRSDTSLKGAERKILESYNSCIKRMKINE